ncbi:MAG: ABC transporter ATP-binding protein [Butyrivibrio sp.]|nr:ABC transporter ATP-binding protein [Butyrivibrio sp.]MBR1643594.1 ABC transporter ATP-binding protein [Butyrivibrio sp.]
MSDTPLLEVKDLVAKLPTKDGELSLINGISFSVGKDETFGIIGESGCGKTMTSMTILRYAERIGLKVVGGQILFEGEDVLKFSGKRLASYNGNDVAVILQDPMQALDPLYTVGDQMLETIRKHHKIPRKEAVEKMKNITGQLSISQEKLSCYPHQLSGGMLQRIVGAIVVSCNPKLIIADEPTTALDVTVQLQYLKLLKDIQKIWHTSIIFISHDIHVISMICDRIAVMYAGNIVEIGTKDDLFNNPTHPYTKALFEVASVGKIPQERYQTIEGNPPDLREEICGCHFAERCPYLHGKCNKEKPCKTDLGNGHEVFCWRVADGKNN